MTTNISKGPTVTPEQLKEHIKGCTYTVLPNGVTTVCQLTLKNGYSVEGYSACAAPENFNKQLGEQYSREMAERNVWPLLGYALKAELHLVEQASKLDMEDEIFNYGDPKTYIGTKVIHAVPMTRLEYNRLRRWTLPEDEDGNDQGYLVQYADGQETNVEGFGGYVSWSPKDVFEGSYKPVKTPRPTTYLERMEQERLELHERHTRLQVFTQSNTFHNDTDEADQEDLMSQVSAMKLYLEILDRRIVRAKT